MRRTIRLTPVLIPFLLWSAAAVLAGDRDIANWRASFCPEAFTEHVRYLASDELEGRGTGSPGIEIAAEYIAAWFKDHGLKPAGHDGTYYHNFEIKRGKKLVDEKAELVLRGSNRKWKLHTDWVPLPFSASEEISGPIAFAGYGIDAPNHEFNDYADFVADGKILLMFRYEPQSDDEKAKFGGKEASRHALFTTKARVAAKKGAKGVIIVSPPNYKPPDEKLFGFDERLARETYDLPVVHVTAELANAILSAGGLPPVEKLQAKLDQERKSLSQDLKNVSVSVKPGIEPNAIKARNVVAMLEGDGGTDEMIVVGAHHDHLGIATRSFRSGGDDTKHIHNGADDNASGTAGVLELARVLSSGPKLRRNVVLMTFSGEEMGLLGSRDFVNKPTIDLAKVKAMINYDMIGRLNEDKFLIYGIPTAEEFKPIVERACSEVGIRYKAAKALPGNSDHASFQRKKIPVLFPFTGLHRQYHQPEDDWELINVHGAIKVLQMGTIIISELANMEEGPNWNESRRESDERDEGMDMSAIRGDDDDKKPAAKADPPKDEAQPRMPTVRLGIMPDYSDDGKPGLRLEGTRAGSLADKAGLREGDRLLKLGGTQIKDIYTYMQAMGNVKAGDVIELVIERDGKQQTVKITAEAPKDAPGGG